MSNRQRTFLVVGLIVTSPFALDGGSRGATLFLVVVAIGELMMLGVLIRRFRAWRRSRRLWRLQRDIDALGFDAAENYSDHDAF